MKYDPAGHMPDGLKAEMVERWKSWGMDVTTYEYLADLQLQHDLISPWQETQAVVYPVLVDLIRGAAEGPGE